MKQVDIADGVTIGDGRLALIAGPCVLESEALAISIAQHCKRVAASLDMPYVFKASFDKANRTAITSYRGPEFERSLEMLRRVRAEVGIPVLTDIHESAQAPVVAEAVDVLQIPAFLCRQTDLLVAAAKTGRAINVKKGQFLAPWDIAHVLQKLEFAGADRVLVTERGTCFGYNTLVVDFRSLALMRDLGRPVVFDASHSVQAPGGAGGASGGDRRFVPALARAAAAVGVDAIFVEVHPEPDSSPSDGPNMLRLDHLERVLEEVVAVSRAATARH